MYKIAIVDDEPEIVKVFEEFLSKMGYEVITASDGETALEIIKSNETPDLLVMDLKMPKVNGIEVLKRMREKNRSIPIIILSGLAGIADYVDDLKGLGYNDTEILHKPVEFHELLEMIKKRLPEGKNPKLNT